APTQDGGRGGGPRRAPAGGSPRRSLSPHQVGGTAVTGREGSWRTAPSEQEQDVARGECRAKGELSRNRDRCAGHERLDYGRNAERRDHAHYDEDSVARFLREGAPAWTVAGGDDAPPDPKSGPRGDADRGEL